MLVQFWNNLSEKQKQEVEDLEPVVEHIVLGCLGRIIRWLMPA